MKIALCSSFVPFVSGGARNIVDWLVLMLEENGHSIEKLYIPEVPTPGLLFEQMYAYRWMDLSAADRIICFRPQSHLIPHPNKILWFIHHIRSFYDLWDTPYRGFPDDARHRGLRDLLYEVDDAAIREAQKVFTNSERVSERLKKFNQVDSEVLYPPVFNPARFYCKTYNDEVVCICRLEEHKRQHLLIEAMYYTTTPIRLRICGASMNSAYVLQLQKSISSLQLKEKVILENRWISEEEKADYLAHCLAAMYLPFDEDSYGYPSIEASHSAKAILTTTDSGGVIELVQDGVNGFVTEPEPKALAEALDKLYRDRANTIAMGQNAKHRLKELNINWEHVLKRLLA